MAVLREVVADFLSKRGDTRITVELDTDDVSQADVLTAVDHGRFYEHETAMALLRILDEGDVFLDIGANVGFFTVLAGKLVGPSGHVFAIELNPRHHHQLERHIAINELSATVLSVAVGRETGRAFFTEPCEGDGNGVLLTPDDPTCASLGANNLVSVETLDSLADQYERLGHANAIKIDVEGAEGWVLLGAERLLRSAALNLVIIEGNPPIQERVFGVSFDRIRELMDAHGFDAYLLSPSGQLPTHVPPNVRINFAIVCNVAFMRPDLVARSWPTVDNIPARVVFRY